MASIYDISRYKGLAINRAFFFDDSDYIYWKTRMRVFLQSKNVDRCDVVEEGPYVQIKLVDRRQVKKLKEEWNGNDKS